MILLVDSIWNRIPCLDKAEAHAQIDIDALLLRDGIY